MDQRPNYRQAQRSQQVATPVSTPPAPAPTPTKATFTPQPAEPKDKNIFQRFWWVLLLLVVAAVAAWYFLFNSSQINPARYQAVFLTNGQVYFGKIHDYYGARPYMTEVYYIQAADGSAADASKQASASNTQKLIKLGKEVHGPENKLILNKDAVLFVENLTDDSNVVKAIKSDSSK